MGTIKYSLCFSIMTKDETLSFIYLDPAGYGSAVETYKEARKKDKTITMQDVKEFIAKHSEQKKQLRGYNSFIAQGPKEEYQVDLFFIPKKDFPNETFVGGVIAIDIFTKFISIVPIKSKTIPEILEAIKEIIKKMGNPKSVYSDNEGAWSAGTEISKWFQDENIKHIITLSHPAFSERAIRTLKGQIYKRVKTPSPEKWTEFLYPILAKYNYKSVHSSTGYTPAEASKQQHHSEVKLHMEMRKNKTRLYPDVNIGDYVKIHKNKDKLDKENVSTWSDKRYKVNDIDDSSNQKLCFLDGYNQNGRVVGLLRHDILLVS